ncbi:hypothetical protein [Corynebacterium sp. NML130628]|uniref:hypothetical protein n=1 Tax=Corynebacterium sp. NML130628 TaxID=1906333 RepID=UPI0008FB72A5|nr:hypothetical protein [Corynebacterium sp. NML130628]OIR44825.1 hypothetical protein BJP07_05015 [Corynebacterium sp. NML130628]
MATTYVVPDHGLGAVRNIPVQDAAQDHIIELLDAADTDVADLATLLIPRAESSGFDIHFQDAVLGSMSASDAREYAELSWIVEASMIPQVTVRATRLADGSLQTVLRLPRPGLCIPTNQPPTDPWVFLDDARTYDVSLLPDAHEAREVSMLDRKHYLLTLSAAEDAAEDTVQVAIGDRAVGTLAGPVATALLPTLRSLQDRGLLAVAHGYLAPLGGKPSLSVTASPLAPDELPPLSPIPPVQVHPRHPDTSSMSATTVIPVVRPEELDTSADAVAKSAAAEADSEEFPAVEAPADKNTTQVQPKKDDPIHPMRWVAAAVGALLIALLGSLAFSEQWSGSPDTVSTYVTEPAHSPSNSEQKPEPSTSEAKPATTETHPESSPQPAPVSEPASVPVPAQPEPAYQVPAQPAPVWQNPAPVQQAPAQQAPAQEQPAPAPAPAPAPDYEYNFGGLQIQSDTPLGGPLHRVQWP